MVGHSEHDDGSSDPIKAWRGLNNFQLLREDPALWN